MHLSLRYFLLFILILGSCRTVEPNSQTKQETDDRSTERSGKLVDVSEKINQFINTNIQAARDSINPQQEEWTDELKIQLIRDIGKRLGANHPGTGIGVYLKQIKLSLEISTLSEIEFYFDQNLKDDTEILRTLFKDSRYSDNKIGPKALVISHILRSTADHSISPIIRVGDSLIGLDKLGHFAEQGLWYFLATHAGNLNSELDRYQFGQYMEGDPGLDRELYGRLKKVYGTYCKTCVLVKEGFGYYGMESTGVCSFADIEANESGYRFYQAIYEDPESYVFDIKLINTSVWNETIKNNVYKPGLQIRE